ncbi:MAG TPA: hypothetical protein P5079_09260, partial [Elusimicrobiota bacterium]|nr:hypothetical protein [Elusimicrobiota bacterium]
MRGVGLKLQKLAYLETLGVPVKEIQKDILAIPFPELVETVEELLREKQPQSITQFSIRSRWEALRERKQQLSPADRVAAVVARLMVENINAGTDVGEIPQELFNELARRPSFLRILAYGLTPESIRRIVTSAPADLSGTEKAIRTALGEPLADGANWVDVVRDTDVLMQEQENAGWDYLPAQINRIRDNARQAGRLQEPAAESLGKLLYQRALLRLNITYFQIKYGLYGATYGARDTDKKIRETLLNLATFSWEPGDGYHEFGGFRMGGFTKYPIDYGLNADDVLLDLTATQHGAFHQITSLEDLSGFYAELDSGLYAATPAYTPIPVRTSDILGAVPQANTGWAEDGSLLAASHNDGVTLQFSSVMQNIPVRQMLEEVEADLPDNVLELRDAVSGLLGRLMGDLAPSSGNTQEDLYRTLEGIYLCLKEERARTANAARKRLADLKSKTRAKADKLQAQIDKLEPTNPKRAALQAKLALLQEESLAQKKELEEKIAQLTFKAFKKLYTTPTQDELRQGRDIPAPFKIGAVMDYNRVLERLAQNIQSFRKGKWEVQLDTYGRGPRRTGFDYYYTGGDPVKMQFLAHVLYRLPAALLPKDAAWSGGLDPATAVNLLRSLPKNPQELMQRLPLSDAQKQQIGAFYGKLASAEAGDWLDRLEQPTQISDVEDADLRGLLEQLKREELKLLMERMRQGDRNVWAARQVPAAEKEAKADSLEWAGQYDAFQTEAPQKPAPVPQFVLSESDEQAVQELLALIAQGPAGREEAAKRAQSRFGISKSALQEALLGFFPDEDDAQVYRWPVPKPQGYALPASSGNIGKSVGDFFTEHITSNVLRELMAKHLQQRVSKTKHWLYKRMPKAWQEVLQYDRLNGLKALFTQMAMWGKRFGAEDNLVMVAAMGDYFVSQQGRTLDLVIGMKKPPEDERANEVWKQVMEKGWKTALLQRVRGLENVFLAQLDQLVDASLLSSQPLTVADLEGMAKTEDFGFLAGVSLADVADILALRLNVSIVPMDWLLEKGDYAGQSTDANTRGKLLTRMVTEGILLSGPKFNEPAVMDLVPAENLLNRAAELVASAEAEARTAPEVARGRLSLAHAILEQATRFVAMPADQREESVEERPPLEGPNGYIRYLQDRLAAAHTLLLRDTVRGFFHKQSKALPEETEAPGWLGGVGDGSLEVLYEMAGIEKGRRPSAVTREEGMRIAQALEARVVTGESADRFAKYVAGVTSTFGKADGSIRPVSMKNNVLTTQSLSEETLTIDVRLVDAPELLAEKHHRLAVLLPRDRTPEEERAGKKGRFYTVYFQSALLDMDPTIQGLVAKSIVEEIKGISQGKSLFAASEEVQSRYKNQEEFLRQEVRRRAQGIVKVRFSEPDKIVVLPEDAPSTGTAAEAGAETATDTGDVVEPELADEEEAEEEETGEEDLLEEPEKKDISPETPPSLAPVTPEQVPQRLAQAAADYIKALDLPRVALVNDDGTEASKWMARVLAANGITVHVTKNVSLPAFSGGLKTAGTYALGLYGDTLLGPQGDIFAGEKMATLRSRAAGLNSAYAMEWDNAVSQDRIQDAPEDWDSRYLAGLETDPVLDLSVIRSGRVQMVVDLRKMSPASQKALRQLFDRIGVHGQYLLEGGSDETLPNLLKKGKGAARLGVVFEEHAQRMTLVDADGQTLSSDDVALLFARHLNGKISGRRIAKSPMDTKLLETLAERFGVELDEVSRPAGAEGNFVMDDWRPWNDVLAQALLAAELAGTAGKPLSTVLQQLYEEMGEPNTRERAMDLPPEHRRRID